MKSPSLDNDLEAFPPTVRRKYLSTLEKLRLARACSKPFSSASSDLKPFKATRTPTRPPLNRSKSSSYLRPTSRRSKKAPTNEHLSTADAQLFLRLPDKLQRRHFTQDEQRMLAGRCEEVILDSTDATLYKLGRQNNRSVPSLRPSSSSSASTNSSLYFEAEQDPTNSAIDMDDAMLEKLRWMDSHDHLDLTLDDYHSHIIEAAGAKSFSSDRRPSFHKNFSFSPMPLNGASPSASRKIPSTRTATPTSLISLEKPHNHNASQASTTFLPIHQNRTSLESTAAPHYQDPDTRLKLRVYLASASKFDEALELGFPALPAAEATTRPSLSDRRYVTTPANPETFFDDENTSVFDALDCPSDDEADASSLPEIDPITPSSAVFQSMPRLPTLQCTSNESSADLKSDLKPKLRYLSPEPPSTPTSRREMTLRMTLTRPDLRARGLDGAEESDPLALAELPPARNGRTIWDTAPREKGWRRVWRRVSGRRNEE